MSAGSAAGAYSCHGLLCAGCYWALKAMLFVGGVMNLAWVAALALAVAIEKLAPGDELLVAACVWRFAALAFVS